MVVVLIATVALIAGTLTVYSIGELLNNQTEDPRESPHNYSVTGPVSYTHLTLPTILLV